MGLSPTLIGVIIIAIIFVPIVYLIMNASGRDKKIKKSVEKLSEAQGLKLNQIDIIGNLIIGVDEVSKKLIYTTKNNATNDYKILDLDNVKDCRAKTIKNDTKTLDWVGLEFTEKAGKNEITFYDEHDEHELGKDAFVCLQDAKRWEGTLKPLLKTS